MKFTQTASCSTAIEYRKGFDTHSFPSSTDSLFDFNFYEHRHYQKQILDSLKWNGKDHAYCKNLFSVRQDFQDSMVRDFNLPHLVNNPTYLTD